VPDPVTETPAAEESLQRIVDEQAALRRVATLVARESSPVEIFGAVTEEACRVLGSEAVGLLRFEPDETATLVSQSDTPWDPPPLGSRFTLDGENVVTEVFRTGETVRVDDWSGATGAVAAMATVLGVRSAVASPVVVEGRLWGTIIAATSQDEPLPAATESRLEQFTGLVATAIANAEARGALSRLAEEQAALRRIAVLVAQQPLPVEVFAAVTEAVGPLLGADMAAMHIFRDEGAATVVASWSQAGPTLPIGTKLSLDGDSAVALIFRTGAAARIDGYAHMEGETAEIARGLRLRTAVGAPILVEGKLWGALMAAARGDEPLPEDAEARITAFTELVATAVSNAQAREELHGLADEQAALRRVATLVAEDAPPAEFFRAAAVEVGTLLGADFSGIARLADGAVIPLAGWASEGEHPPLPERWPMQPGDPVTAIAEAQRAVRWDSWIGIDGPIAAFIRDELDVSSTVGTPIVVEARMWGVLAVHSRKPLPQESESRMEQFSNLVATAIGNAEARGEVARLANEQAALRRVATLVAEGTAPGDLFAAVAAEAAAVIGVSSASVSRFLVDGVSEVLASLNDPGFPVGSRWQPDEGTLNATLLKAAHPIRIDQSAMSGPIAEASEISAVRSVVGAPICLEGRVWGMVAVGRQQSDEPLPPDAEARLTGFTELIATAISNMEARDGERRLAAEQAALRRVATLVAASAAPSHVFAAVTEEIALVLGADATLLCRADRDGAAVVVGNFGDKTPRLGTRLPHGGANLTTIVLDTGHPARIESYVDATGDASEVARSHGLRSAVGAPILVEGRLWGLVIAGTTVSEPLAPDAEERLAGFTELVATAISNADARDGERRLVEEQAALRRVAEIVAREASPDEVFAAIAETIGGLLDQELRMVRFEDDETAVAVAASEGPHNEVFPVGFRMPLGGNNVLSQVFRTGEPARIDEYGEASGPIAEAVRESGVRSAVATPIVVGNRRWGAMLVGAFGDEPLAPGTESWLGQFTELMATAISNAEARAAEQRLTEEQAALRRVATLVAQGVPTAELFSAVSREMEREFSGVDPTLLASVIRFDPGPECVLVAASRPYEQEPVGSRWKPRELYVSTRVLRTGESARVDEADLEAVGGPDADVLRLRGFLYQVGSPVVVDGRLWGAISLNSAEALPPDTDKRLSSFTELIASAIANAESRDAISRLADEQAALRRVATLVARDAPSAEVFAAVAMEVGKLLDADVTIVGRYDDDGYATAIGNWSASPGGIPVGTRSAIGGRNVLSRVAETGKPARMDAYDEATGEAAEIARRHGWRSSIAAPITVEGRVWGTMLVATRREQPFPAGSEKRLAAFTGLVATALANANVRSQLLESRARIVAAGDEARRRIERNLHDGTQQRLIALGLDIAAVRASIPEGQRDLDANLERLEDDVDEVLGEVRELSRGLHPGLLTRQGLGPSLRALARKSSLPVSLEIDLPERPPEPVETATYFVVSEALTNAVKYAQASYLTVSISVDESHLRATIADDGVGGAEPGAGAGSGLIGLLDRVNALSGRFELESPRGRGTTISIELPLAQ